MKTEETTMTPKRDPNRPPARGGPNAWRRLRNLGSALALAALAFVLWALQPDGRGPAADAEVAGWGGESVHATADAPLAWLVGTYDGVVGWLGAAWMAVLITIIVRSRRLPGAVPAGTT